MRHQAAKDVGQMPWEQRTVMQERERFVEDVENQVDTVTALCLRYGISRKTGYKWIKRAAEGRRLCDQSRRPHQQPSKTARDTEELILALRKDNPTWGGKTIKAVLESAGFQGIPSAKTCGNILKRNGCIDPEEAKKHQPFQRFEREKCNELWQTDFKGDFLLGDNTRCYPLTILDDHSRFSIRIEPKYAAKGVIESFTLAFQEYGLPDAVLSDNGSQFSGFKGGYTQFERFLMDLDVAPLHGRIMHPQTQGKIERFHRTLKQEALRTTPENIRAAEKLFAEWRFKYNELRPHSALQMKTPASVYHPSERALFQPKPYEYDLGARVVKTNNWGYLRFGPIQVYLSETMRDTHLEVRPTENESFLVIYRNYKIAEVDAVENKLLNRRIRRL